MASPEREGFFEDTSDRVALLENADITAGYFVDKERANGGDSAAAIAHSSSAEDKMVQRRDHDDASPAAFNGSNELGDMTEPLTLDDSKGTDKEQAIEPFDEIDQSAAIPKTLTMWNGVSFIVGTMIGSGIFASPGSVLLQSKSVGVSLLAWVLSGIVALIGSACYAELGTVVPESGGEYVYINAGLNRFLAFLFSWASCMITRPGSQAIMILVSGEYLVRPFYTGGREPPVWVPKAAAIVLNTLIVLINSVSVKAATRLQSYSTALKVLVLVVISIVGLVFLARDASKDGTPAHDNLSNGFKSTSGTVTAGAFGLSVINGLWSYDGWNNLNYITAEMKKPARDLPRALFIGMPLVIVIYLFVNVAYFAVLPLASIVDFENNTPNESFAADFASATMGAAGLVVIPLCIALSAFGAANGSAFTGARLVRESAVDGHFPAVFGNLWSLSAGSRAPVPALLSQYVLSSIMILTGNFDALVAYFSAAAWFFYFLAVLSLLRLRRIRKSAPRPFSVPLVVPIVFLVIAFFLVLSLIIQAPTDSLISLAFILSGVPYYYLQPRVIKWFRHRRKHKYTTVNIAPADLHEL
ncbi:solute carrier family 7 [Salpingoeca rosetta]|uniref:Solute carrier family 7 n=1 Tax=Salpingoeca rosetta (strain ATCC 50818 / BSB-021) TaxID=946362 RepID=F2UF60_SALR5|nr:solute carrier family 7 [Salpingoeca rosetta]EGD75260.1 solute carrier family 7 [Salpingoeca rosetta]|eukprot:XP_004992313.1 solute carrier family 7 [Salpingoeca rosetta]